MAPCRRDVTGLRRSLKPLALRCEELLLTMTDVKKPHQNNVKIKHTYEYISCCKYMASNPPRLCTCGLAYGLRQQPQIAHCAFSSNLFHGQITQKHVDQLSDPENKTILKLFSTEI